MLMNRISTNLQEFIASNGNLQHIQSGPYVSNLCVAPEIVKLLTLCYVISTLLPVSTLPLNNSYNALKYVYRARCTVWISPRRWSRECIKLVMNVATCRTLESVLCLSLVYLVKILPSRNVDCKPPVSTISPYTNSNFGKRPRKRCLFL
jgi:hypothetical protein